MLRSGRELRQLAAFLGIFSVVGHVGMGLEVLKTERALAPSASRAAKMAEVAGNRDVENRTPVGFLTRSVFDLAGF